MEKTINSEKIDTLFKKVQGGDTDAFGEIYDLLMPNIYRYICAKVPYDIAEDLTEDTFYKAWLYRKKFKKRSNIFFHSWIFRIAHNLVVDYYRNNKKLEILSYDIVDNNKINQPQFGIETDFLHLRLKHVINKLSLNLRQVVVLRFINDFSYKQIASMMNKTEGAIRVLVHRAIGELRELIAGDK